MTIVFVSVLVRIAMPLMLSAWRFRPIARFRCSASGFDQLVQLTAVQPNAAAFGTIVYLNALTLGHGQCGLVNWTLHIGIPLSRQF